MPYIHKLANKLKSAQNDIKTATTQQKNELLMVISEMLIECKAEILSANERDLKNASQNNIQPTMIDRLTINESRIIAMANGVKKVAELPDPVGEIIYGKVLENGLKIRKQRVPIGIIGIIYESRPNVTVDATALCIKTSNAVMLRGGKEAIETNIALIKVMQSAIIKCRMNPDIIALVEDTSRKTATEMMQLNDYLDVLIPRGGAGLIKAVVANATIPVIETGVGNCHIYIDKSADLDMGADIVFNAKTSRPSVCNACESLLVHESVAKEFLPKVKKKLDEKSVIILGCEKTIKILGKSVSHATEDDYAAEFLDYVISIKVVSSIDEAINHIDKFSTGHSEAIITNDINSADLFTSRVDSAAVYVNASTRFTDGEEFGFGAEIGISTQKLHARGPMGLNELTSSKFIINGNGQIR